MTIRTRSDEFTWWGPNSRLLCAAVLFALLATPDGRADRGVVINEIMYHPPRDLDQVQYVELFNGGDAAADLSGWAFTKGIHFVFPTNTTLGPGAFLVVCRNRPAFVQHYGTAPVALGDFSGKLSHRRETVELSDAHGHIVEAVKYADEEPWPTGPDGYSASLERVCPFQTGRDPESWMGSRLATTAGPGGTPGRQNDSFSSNPPPVVAQVRFQAPLPDEETRVTAEVADADGVNAVSVLWRTITARERSPETELPMRRVTGSARQARYEAAIPGQPEGTLVRFRIKAVDAAGATRLHPSPNEPRPDFSYATFRNTNTARIPFAYVLSGSSPGQARDRGSSARRSIPEDAGYGDGAFIYVPPGGGEVLTFDHVHVRPRSGGFKVHFQNDRPFHGMTGINIIFEGPPRWVLAESLAYEVYRMAGVPAPLTEHVRVWHDGRLLGYQLLIEQPNKSFLARNQRANDGSLYKLLWYGQGLVGQHEKKTQLASGHADLRELIEGLNHGTGAEQWAFIQKQFQVDEFASYYAVNMCIQNWDGFFNNYFTYHDTATGKWEIYPWDEDKTWGDFDGATPPYRWCEMPLTMGMNGDRPEHAGGWWRPGGWFSGPLLANAGFRSRFLDRLGEFCASAFTEEKFAPFIDAMEQRLEAEVPVRARLTGEDPQRALRAFHVDMESFRNQVKQRRQFILSELPKAKRSTDQ